LIHVRSVSCLLVLSMLSTASVLAQKLRPRADSDYEPRQPAGPPLPAALLQELTAIRDAALTDDYAYRQVAHLTENIGPRPVGSTQAQAAIEYVAGEMRKLGLEVRLEPVQARHWIRGAETAELV
jgi:carboxypeptidase Q